MTGVLKKIGLKKGGLRLKHTVNIIMNILEVFFSVLEKFQFPSNRYTFQRCNGLAPLPIFFFDNNYDKIMLLSWPYSVNIKKKGRYKIVNLA